jgi:hypothetical protein
MDNGTKFNDGIHSGFVKSGAIPTLANDRTLMEHYTEKATFKKRSKFFMSHKATEKLSQENNRIFLP